MCEQNANMLDKDWYFTKCVVLHQTLVNRVYKPSTQCRFTDICFLCCSQRNINVCCSMFLN